MHKKSHPEDGSKLLFLVVHALESINSTSFGREIGIFGIERMIT
jgi:hypothetical protein